MVKMNLVEEVLNKVQNQIDDFFVQKGINNPSFSFERTSDQKFGDFSTNVAMKYSKLLETNATTLAQQIVDYLSNQINIDISKFEAVNPGFLNLYFDKTFFDNYLYQINKSVDTFKFGKNIILNNQKWVVEHTSPNPNKAMHLGHLRNNLVGMGIVRMLEWNGASVVSDAVYNDRGIAIAKLMYGFLAHMKKSEDSLTEVTYWSENMDKWYSPEEKNVSYDVFVTECYIQGERDFKNDLDIEKKVRNLVVGWENGDRNIWKLWKHVLDYAYTGVNRTLSRLGNHWDKIWYEHEHYQKGKDFITKGVNMEIFKILEDGAVLTNLEKYNIPDTILLKNDGTSLYITQDIALTSLKKDFYKADKLVWVIGPEQSLAMRQLFAVCEQLNIGKIEDFTHITYGYVGLRGDNGGFKKMSSREGTVVLIDDVIDEVKDKIKQKFIAQNREIKDNLNIISEKLALAAVKFSLLRSDRVQDLVFDVDQSIDVNGDSGIYVIYAYVRTQSILRKSKNKNIDNLKFPELFGDEEKLLRNLISFPEVVKRAQENMSVHHVAQYLLEICSAFNSWYGKEIILDGSNKEDYKLLITKAVGIVIKNGLEILGIDTIEEI